MLKKILRKNRITANLLETYFFSKKYLKPKGWFESCYKGMPLDEQGKPIPWFTYSSLHFIEQKMALKPMNVFEYGSGNSTIWFSARSARILSIEHDKDFYTKMSKEFSSIGNITYELRNLNENYSEKILEYNNEYDVIIIDGRERVKCVKNCINALKKDGIIIFDNSERTQYATAYDYLTKNQFRKIDFKGILAIGHAESQTSIYYRDDNCFGI